MTTTALKGDAWRRDGFVHEGPAKPAAVHASTPPFNAFTDVKPCARYFAA